jgi:hypothetical protein
MSTVIRSVALLLGMATVAYAQSLTLRERAALTSENELNVGIRIEGAASPLEDLVAAADLIVVGKVLPGLDSYLSADGMSVLTDYPIAVERVIAGRVAVMNRPGIVPHVTVVHRGGEVTLDGKRVRMHDLRLPALPVSSRVVLLLNRQEDGKYAIVHEVFGAFGITGDFVGSLARKGRGPENLNLAEFIKAISAMEGRRAVHPK